MRIEHEIDREKDEKDDLFLNEFPSEIGDFPAKIFHCRFHPLSAFRARRSRGTERRRSADTKRRREKNSNVLCRVSRTFLGVYVRTYVRFRGVAEPDSHDGVHTGGEQTIGNAHTGKHATWQPWQDVDDGYT